MKCDECGRDKVEAIGEWVCPYHGYITKKSNNTPFMDLEIGDKFYFAHARPGEARLAVKLRDGVGYNSQFVDMDTATCGCGPMAMVVREGDVEPEFWNLPTYVEPSQPTPVPSKVVLGDPATEKQLQYLMALNAWHEPAITKSEASQLISAAKGYRLVDKSLYAVKPINATCHLCGRTAPVEGMDEESAHDWDNPDEDVQGTVTFYRYTCADKDGCRQLRFNSAAAARLVAEVDEAGRYDDNSPGKIGI